MKAYGVVSDLGQRQAVLHNLFIHFGINKDVDEKDLLATTKINLDKKYSSYSIFTSLLKILMN